MKRLGWMLVVAAALVLAGPLISLARGDVDMSNSWRTASRQSAGIAPDPAAAPEAIVQVYAARAFGWRGAFGVHSWIATKRAGAPDYTVYQVIGWHRFYGRPALVVRSDVPDRYWYGSRPDVLVEARGDGVERLIDRIEAAVAGYPFADSYRLWPGPNSNSFTGFVARQVPELSLELPPTAVGKDYLGPDSFFAPAPSGTGYQLSLFGLLGVLVAEREGLEINLLGLTFGIDPLGLALKLPGLGRVGVGDKEVRAGAAP
jgi:hypothetical protein